ncbi:MAG: hypothetical protein GY856_49795 [bacterium]|nr:hypothetical protein [bacterium]
MLDSFLEIVSWMNEGPWYSVVLKVFGVIGVLTVLRGLFFACSEITDDDSLITRLFQLTFYLATVATVILFIAMIWLAFFR